MYGGLLEYCRTGHALEKHLVQSFVQLQAAGCYEEMLPTSPEDTIIEEMAFRYGRADLVIFHIDGSATVIEAKDGSKGYSHVVGGIGQAGLYASQLGSAKGGVTRVRRCLMWSSTGDDVLDLLIGETCLKAGVVPLCRLSSYELVEIGRRVLAERGLEY